MTVHFFLNGRAVETNADPLSPLAEVMRDEFAPSIPARGCSSASCGKCIVLMDNEPVFSCLIPLFRVKDKQVLTYDGFKDSEDCSDIERGFREAGFTPCPFHAPGYIFLVHSLLERVSHPGYNDAAVLFAGLHPLCGGFSALLEGIYSAAARRFRRHNEQTR